MFSLGREPQDQGDKKNLKPRSGDRCNRFDEWPRLTPRPKSVAPPGLRKFFVRKPGAHAPGYTSVAPSELLLRKN